MKYLSNKKGQAVAEFAIVGALVLLAFGIMLSFLQRFNDQQYAQMETFRRALDKACTYLGETSEGAGASVQYTLLEDRQHADLNSGLGKGSSTTVSGSANVFWAVPKVGAAQSDSLIIYKVNEDELARNYSEFIPQEQADNWAFTIEPMDTRNQVDYFERATKEETPQQITNIRSSQLHETKATIIPYSIRIRSDDGPAEDDSDVVRRGTFWEGHGQTLAGMGEGWDGREALVQYGYRDSNRQYKYSSQVPDSAIIERSRAWITEFAD